MSLTVDDVKAALPTDMETLHKAWIDAHPEKASRLETLTAQFVEAFREAAGANPACVLDDDPTTVPTVARHHALNLIDYSLGMEMGVQFAPEVVNLNTQANVWLRMAPTSSVDLTGSAVRVGTPSFRHRHRVTGEWVT